MYCERVQQSGDAVLREPWTVFTRRFLFCKVVTSRSLFMPTSTDSGSKPKVSLIYAVFNLTLTVRAGVYEEAWTQPPTLSHDGNKPGFASCGDP